ncbi:O-antigen ligase family protein [Haloplanus sp. GCM10025708]|uniref:O-antigen ligase family protein n=1 Tax=Haloferacaceae TaxID=1644056 RepID=UPI00360BA810
MTWRRLVERVQFAETGYAPRGDALALGGCLAAGLALVVPILSLATPVPTLAWTALLAVAYGVVAAVIGRVTVGAYAALLVTMTFAANVPLASNEYLRSMTRDLGPNVWLVHLPLLALLGLLVLRDSDRFRRVSGAEILLAAFVGWVVVAALVTRPVRIDAALYFALFVLWGGLIFAAVRRSHDVLPVAPRTTLSILACTLLFKSWFALAEAVRGGSFGLTRLGELSSDLAVTVATLSLGGISLSVGTYVSGFSGMSFLLASLVVLLVPFVLAQTLERSPTSRFLGAASAFVVLLALRLTGTDAGRGAAMLAMGCFAAWVLLRSQSGDRSLDARRLSLLFVVLVCVGIVLVPSTQSGAAGDVSTAILDGSSGGGSTATTDTGEISVPLFDLSNLGIRLTQYAAGISLFLQHPLFGIGGANFPYYADSFGIPDQLPIHNVYLTLLAETGVVGFVLYVGFLVAVVRRGVRSLRSEATDVYVRGAALAGVVGYLGFMFWDHMLFNSVVSSFTFYAVCGALATEPSDA